MRDPVTGRELARYETDEVVPVPSYYLTGDTAIGVSTMTDLPWCWQRVSSKGKPVPYLDLSELPYWDKMRAVWALIGGHKYCDSVQ